jgi:hypothetical protein
MPAASVGGVIRFRTISFVPLEDGMTAAGSPHGKKGKYVLLWERDQRFESEMMTPQDGGP